jgi:hypothetical protein
MRLKGIAAVVLCACIAVSHADQACDTTQDVYQNRSAMVVTMEFTDGCRDADSYVYVKDHTGGTIATLTVPDLTTRSFTVDVPAGGIISFQCRGNQHNTSGACSSRMISAFQK